MTTSKIFALKGPHNCGKTPVLKAVIVKLLSKYGTTFITDDGKSLVISDISLYKDLIGTININGKVVAVNTAGDCEHDINNTIALFEKGFDVGLCAVPFRSVIRHKIDEFANKHCLKDGIDYFVVCKMHFGNFNDAINKAMIDNMNENQAQWLVDKICKYL